MGKLTWELRRKQVLGQGRENKCCYVFRADGVPCSVRPDNGGFLGTLLGLFCSFCFTTVSNKDTYFFLVGSSSFVRMDLKSSLRRKHGVAFLPLIQIQLLRWLVTSAHITVELP